MFNFKFRFIAVSIVFAFASQEIAQATPVGMTTLFPGTIPMPRVNFRLPDSVAVIEDGWTAPAASKKAARTIILIQDAHTNDSAQMNLAHALHTILPAEGIKYVFTEAAQGDVSLSYLKPQFPRLALEEAARQFVRKGLIKGSEYLNVSSDDDFVIWGVEDKKLYDDAILAYQAEADNRHKALGFISRAQASLEELKPENTSDAYYKLDRLKTDYADGKITLTAYLDGLKEAMGGKTLSTGLKTLDHLDILRAREAALDMTKIAKQQATAIQTLTAADRDVLLAGNSQRVSPFAFKPGAAAQNPNGFYTLLEAKLIQAHIARDPFADLFNYFDYLHAAKKLNAIKVLKELDAFETAAFDRVSATREEKWFTILTKNLHAWRSMLELTMTPEEYSRYQTEKELFDLDVICGFINGVIGKSKRHYDRALATAGETDQARQAAETFYNLTFRRDAAFIEKLTAKMDSDRIQKAVLITGGYHSTNLKALLRQNGFSYVSIIPQVTHETDHNRYERLLLKQVASIQKDRTALAKADTSTGSKASAHAAMLTYTDQTPGAVADFEAAVARLAGMPKVPAAARMAVPELEGLMSDASRESVISLLKYIEQWLDKNEYPRMDVIRQYVEAVNLGPNIRFDDNYPVSFGKEYTHAIHNVQIFLSPARIERRWKEGRIKDNPSLFTLETVGTLVREAWGYHLLTSKDYQETTGTSLTTTEVSLRSALQEAHASSSLGPTVFVSHQKLIMEALAHVYVMEFYEVCRMSEYLTWAAGRKLFVEAEASKAITTIQNRHLAQDMTAKLHYSSKASNLKNLYEFLHYRMTHFYLGQIVNANANSRVPLAFTAYYKLQRAIYSVDRRRGISGDLIKKVGQNLRSRDTEHLAKEMYPYVQRIAAKYDRAAHSGARMAVAVPVSPASRKGVVASPARRSGIPLTSMNRRKGSDDLDDWLRAFYGDIPVIETVFNAEHPKYFWAMSLQGPGRRALIRMTHETWRSPGTDQPAYDILVNHDGDGHVTRLQMVLDQEGRVRAKETLKGLWALDHRLKQNPWLFPLIRRWVRSLDGQKLDMTNRIIAGHPTFQINEPMLRDNTFLGYSPGTYDSPYGVSNLPSPIALTVDVPSAPPAKPKRLVLYGGLGAVVPRFYVEHLLKFAEAYNIEFEIVDLLAREQAEARIKDIGLPIVRYTPASEYQITPENRPDGILVLTRPDSHFRLIEMANEHDIPAFVEKPITHPAHLRQLMEQFKKHPEKLLAIDFFFDNEAVARAIEFINAGKIGRLTHMGGYMIESNIIEPGRGWLTDEAISGGGLGMDMLVHLLALCEMILERYGQSFSGAELDPGRLIFVRYPDAPPGKETFAGIEGHAAGGDVTFKLGAGKGLNRSAYALVVEGTEGKLEINLGTEHEKGFLLFTPKTGEPVKISNIHPTDIGYLRTSQKVLASTRSANAVTQEERDFRLRATALAVWTMRTAGRMYGDHFQEVPVGQDPDTIVNSNADAKTLSDRERDDFEAAHQLDKNLQRYFTENDVRIPGSENFAGGKIRVHNYDVYVGESRQPFAMMDLDIVRRDAGYQLLFEAHISGIGPDATVAFEEAMRQAVEHAGGWKWIGNRSGSGARMAGRIERVRWEDLTDEEQREFYAIAQPTTERAAELTEWDDATERNIAMLFESSLPGGPDRLFSATVKIDATGTIEFNERDQGFDSQVSIVMPALEEVRGVPRDRMAEASEFGEQIVADYLETLQPDERLRHVRLNVLEDLGLVSAKLENNDGLYAEYVKGILSKLALTLKFKMDMRLYLPTEGIANAEHKEILDAQLAAYGFAGEGSPVHLEAITKEASAHDRRLLVSSYFSPDHKDRAHVNFRQKMPDSRNLPADSFLSMVSSALDVVAGKLDTLKQSSTLNELADGDDGVMDRIIKIGAGDVAIGSFWADRVKNRIQNGTGINTADLKWKIMGLAEFDPNQSLMTRIYNINQAFQTLRMIRAAVESAA